MIEMFREGGVAVMVPTLLVGLALVAVCVRYAARPLARLVPLMLALGITTLASGSLGFVLGVIQSFKYIGNVGPGERYVALLGVAESLHNLSLALGCVVTAGLLTTIGTLRMPGRDRTSSEAAV